MVVGIGWPQDDWMGSTSEGTWHVEATTTSPPLTFVAGVGMGVVLQLSAVGLTQEIELLQ